MNNIDSIIEFIKRSDNFIVTSHVSPDGDNLGSTLGMYNLLTKLGKKVIHVLDDNAPRNLTFLVENQKILKSEEVEISEYNLIALDCGDKFRICLSKELVENCNKLVCIDHHASNDNYGDYNYIDINASSTSELVYNLIKRYEELENINIIDENVATALYTGLVTDTGNFAYPNTNPSSFLMAKDLVDRGAKRNMIIQKVFQSNPYNFYKLLGEALDDLQIVDNKIASIAVTKDMLKRNVITFNDIDAITSYTRDIAGVEVGILLKEKAQGEVKVSFRSKEYVDVSEIAKCFGGGGHIRAAGCTIYDSVENARKKVLEAVLNKI